MAGVVLYQPSSGTVLSASTLAPDIVQKIDQLRNRSSAFEAVVVGSRKDQPEHRIFDALATVKMLTAQVAMHLDDGWRKKLFSQLDALHDPTEWEVDDEPVQQSSFATFLKAILKIRPERRPGLGLSNEGHLIAAWTTGRDRLTIEFLPNDNVRWVLSRYYEDGPVRIAGQMVVSRLAEELASHHPEHWFSRESDNNICT